MCVYIYCYIHIYIYLNLFKYTLWCLKMIKLPNSKFLSMLPCHWIIYTCHIPCHVYIVYIIYKPYYMYSRVCILYIQDHLLWIVGIPPVFGGECTYYNICMILIVFLKMNYKAGSVAWWQNSLLACSRLWVQPSSPHSKKRFLGVFCFLSFHFLYFGHLCYYILTSNICWALLCVWHYAKHFT